MSNCLLYPLSTSKKMLHTWCFATACNTQQSWYLTCHCLICTRLKTDTFEIYKNILNDYVKKPLPLVNHSLLLGLLCHQSSVHIVKNSTVIYFFLNVHAILSYNHHPYKHQYYNFEKLRTNSTKLSENKDHDTW